MLRSECCHSTAAVVESIFDAFLVNVKKIQQKYICDGFLNQKFFSRSIIVKKIAGSCAVCTASKAPPIFSQILIVAETSVSCDSGILCVTEEHHFTSYDWDHFSFRKTFAPVFLSDRV